MSGRLRRRGGTSTSRNAARAFDALVNTARAPPPPPPPKQSRGTAALDVDEEGSVPSPGTTQRREHAEKPRSATEKRTAEAAARLATDTQPKAHKQSGPAHKQQKEEQQQQQQQRQVPQRKRPKPRLLSSFRRSTDSAAATTHDASPQRSPAIVPDSLESQNSILDSVPASQRTPPPGSPTASPTKGSPRSSPRVSPNASPLRRSAQRLSPGRRRRAAAQHVPSSSSPLTSSPSTSPVLRRRLGLNASAGSPSSPGSVSPVREGPVGRTTSLPIATNATTDPGNARARSPRRNQAAGARTGTTRRRNQQGLLRAATDPARRSPHQDFVELRHVTDVHASRQAGKNQQHKDDLDYLFESLAPGCNAEVKAIALCQITDMCRHRDVRQYLRAHGRIAPLLRSILDIPRPTLSLRVAALCLLFLLRKDSLTGHVDQQLLQFLGASCGEEQQPSAISQGQATKKSKLLGLLKKKKSSSSTSTSSPSSAAANGGGDALDRRVSECMGKCKDLVSFSINALTPRLLALEILSSVLKPRKDAIQALYRESGVLSSVVVALKSNVKAIRRNTVMAPSPTDTDAYVQDCAELSLRLRILQRAVFLHGTNQKSVCTISDGVVLDHLASIIDFVFWFVLRHPRAVEVELKAEAEQQQQQQQQEQHDQQKGEEDEGDSPKTPITHTGTVEEEQEEGKEQEAGEGAVSTGVQTRRQTRRQTRAATARGKGGERQSESRAVKFQEHATTYDPETQQQEDDDDDADTQQSRNADDVDAGSGNRRERKPGASATQTSSSSSSSAARIQDDSGDSSNGEHDTSSSSGVGADNTDQDGKGALRKTLNRCLCDALRVLLSLTNDNNHVCDMVGRMACVTSTAKLLLLYPALIEPEFRHDIFVLGLSLLANLSEHVLDNRQTILAVDLAKQTAAERQSPAVPAITPGDSVMKSLVRLYADRIVGRSVAATAAHGRCAEVKELEEQRSRRNADQETSDNVVAAYAAIFIGCLCRDNQSGVEQLRTCVTPDLLTAMVGHLKEFLLYQQRAGVNRDQDKSSIQDIITLLESFAATATPITTSAA